MFIFIGLRRQKEPGATLLWPSSLRQERTQNLQSVSPSLNNTHSPLSLEKTAKPHSRRLYRWKFKLADVFRVHCERERDVQCHDSEKTYFTPAGVNTSLAKTSWQFLNSLFSSSTTCNYSSEAALVKWKRPKLFSRGCARAESAGRLAASLSLCACQDCLPADGRFRSLYKSRTPLICLVITEV